MKTVYYAWNGEMATTGTPNRITGNYSKWGDLFVADTKEEAEKWLDDQVYRPVRFVTTSKARVRRQHLGMSVADFEEMLEYTRVEG
jgi:hypothetical protein